MKKRLIVSLIISAAVMFLSLYLTVSYVGGNDGMGVLLLLFGLAYPILSVILGIVSGKAFKKLLLIPILNGIFFLISAWIFLAVDFAFVIGAVIYIGIGVAASAITSAVIKKKAQKTD